MLTRWLGQERDAREPSEVQDDLHAELKPLRRENAVLKQEREFLKKGRGLLRGREKSMTFGFIEAEKASFPISQLCRVGGQPERVLCLAPTACLSSSAAGHDPSGEYPHGLRPVERHL